MIQEAVLAFANRQGIGQIERAPDWHGYEIYVPVYKEMRYIGLPYVIMAKGGIIRMSTPEESLERLDDFPAETAKGSTTITREEAEKLTL